MSEYQYYEFAAVDRPLSVEEQAELRAVSTRALITPTSFVNDYEWGDLKADPRRLVERYFDAFLYLANWGTHRLMFRLPAEVFDSAAVVNRYLVGDGATAWATGGYVVIHLFAEDNDGEYGEEWLDGSGLLTSIIPVRAEIDGRGPAAALPGRMGFRSGTQFPATSRPSLLRPLSAKTQRWPANVRLPAESGGTGLPVVGSGLGQRLGRPFGQGRLPPRLVSASCLRRWPG